jgi:phage terminase large subunit
MGRYKWKVDRSNKTLNEPVDAWNHLIDPLRYIALNKLKINKFRSPNSRLPYQGGKWQEPVVNLITI